MKKFIEAIIEIVLEHVCCTHQLIDEHPRGPKFDDVTYGIDDEQELMKKCLKQKPEVTEEWIDLADEKLWFAIRENPEAFACKDDDYEHEKTRKDLIRSLVEEMQK